jgi:O-antigen ligase
MRSAVIDAYFPPDSTIDSSHNIFIDIAVKYGLIGLGLFV